MLGHGLRVALADCDGPPTLWRLARGRFTPISVSQRRWQRRRERGVGVGGDGDHYGGDGGDGEGGGGEVGWLKGSMPNARHEGGIISQRLLAAVAVRSHLLGAS